jgi:uncharacterized protein
MKMGPIGWIAFVLVVIGGLNWGLVGIFNFDLVAAIFGNMSVIARIVYILVALGAIFMIVKPLLKAKTEAAPAQM